MTNEDIEKVFTEQVDKSKRVSVKLYTECKILLDDMVYNSIKVDKKRFNMDILSLAIIEYAQNHYPKSYKDWRNKDLPAQQSKD